MILVKIATIEYTIKDKNEFTILIQMKISIVSFKLFNR